MSIEKIEEQLKQPFPKIHWRIGATDKKKQEREQNNKYAKATKGIPLAYIDSRDVAKRLDEVIGINNWQKRYPFQGCCEVGIRETVFDKDGHHDSWIWKSDGAGESDIEGIKGQYSDAFKRAAAAWGVGRYLYYLKPEMFPNYGWVQLDEWGNFEPPTLPAWAQFKDE